MDFDFSEDQRLLKESVDRLIAGEYSFEQRKKYLAEPAGYSDAALDGWVRCVRDWASGASPEGVATVAPPQDGKAGRDVYLYVISGHKVRNPAAAVALIERVGQGSRGG